jgi:hypothetical protein
MNERIKELVLEAAYGNIDPNGPFTPEEFNNFTAKFAELIVRECLDIVNRKEYSYHEADPLWETSQLIKQHFGVEE